MRAHTNLLNQILASAPANVRLFKNDQGNVELMDGRRLTFGLFPGSSDLIGFTMVRGLPVFTGIEAKTGSDRVKPKQLKWNEVCRASNCIIVVARSVEECWSEHRAAVAELCARTQQDSDFTP